MAEPQSAARRWLTTASDIAVIALLLLVGYVVVRKYLLPSSQAPRMIRSGDQLPSLPNITWAGHSRNIILVLRKGCPFCERSVPFYRTILQRAAGKSNTEVVAVFPDSPIVASAVTKSERLAVKTVGGVPLQNLRIFGTPTLILADGKALAKAQH